MSKFFDAHTDIPSGIWALAGADNSAREFQVTLKDDALESIVTERDTDPEDVEDYLDAMQECDIDNVRDYAGSRYQKSYSDWRVADLKNECRSLGLGVSGTKAVLVERLEGMRSRE